jgi:transposase-like protein
VTTLERFRCTAVNAVLTVNGCAQNWRNTKREGKRYAYQKAEKLPQCEGCPVGEHHATKGTPHPSQSWHALTIGAPSAPSPTSPAPAAPSPTEPAPETEAMPKHRKYPPETRAKALELLKRGEAVSKVAGELGVSTSIVYYWRKAEREGAPAMSNKAVAPVDQGPPVVVPKVPPEPDASAQGDEDDKPTAWFPVVGVPMSFETAMILRPGRLVRLNLPTDLTADEADRVGTFVRALAPAGSGAAVGELDELLDLVDALVEDTGEGLTLEDQTVVDLERLAGALRSAS